MSKFEEIQKQHIINKINEDMRSYMLDMNANEYAPMFPEKQISDTIDYLRNEGCVKDIDITCENGNITDEGILNVKLDITLKPDAIIRDINVQQ